MKILFRLFFLLLPICGLSQVPYYDAIKLKSIGDPKASGLKVQLTINESNRAAMIQIFKHYIEQDITKADDVENFLNVVSQNPFISISATTHVELAATEGKSLFGQALGAVGGLNVTTIADGFAKFLVKRTKQELNAAFFDRFAELIQDPKYRDAQLLFPQTYATLVAIGREIYTYEAYLNTLRESFESDLNGLLPNLKRVIEDGRYATFFNEHPELKAVCLSSIYIGQQLQHKTHPGQIIADYPVDQILQHEKLLDVNGVVRTSQLLSGSIRSKNLSRYWISSDSLQILAKDNIAFRIYLGLLYQRAKDIRFVGTDLRTIMTNGSADMDKLNAFIKQCKSYVEEFQRRSEFVIVNVKTLQDAKREELEFSDFYALYSSTLDLIEFTLNVYKIPGLEKLEPSEKTLSRISAARSGANIAMDISRRNYASAIVNLQKLYVESLPDTSSSKLQPFILKYGSFMAAVVQAENSDEVAQAIEAVALPSGSSRIKRETEINVSLNSYVGLFLGYERIEGADRSGFEFNSYGVSAPIGVAFSRGHSILFIPTGGWKEKKKGWSTSLFLSVIDLGALAAFRFANDTTETVPDIEFEDIIAPGAFISIGIPKSPLSVNFGIQAGPLLRKVTADINDYSQSYTRFGFSLCVDIPIVNFYSRSRKDLY